MWVLLHILPKGQNVPIRLGKIIICISDYFCCLLLSLLLFVIIIVIIIIIIHAPLKGMKKRDIVQESGHWILKVLIPHQRLSFQVMRRPLRKVKRLWVFGTL